MSSGQKKGKKKGGHEVNKEGSKPYQGRSDVKQRQTVGDSKSYQKSRGNQKPSNHNFGIDKSSLTKVKVTSVDVNKLAVIKNIPTNQFLCESKQPGKTGEPTTLKANYFPLSLPKGPFFQYSVHFKPEVANPKIATRLISNIAHKFGEDNTYVFDGNAVVYTQKHFLREEEKFLEVYSKDKTDEKYQIKVQYSCLISSDTISVEVKHLFNIMYRRALTKLKLQQIGRHHFDLQQAYNVDKHNLIIAPGLLETIYITDHGIFFNANVIYRSLRTDTLLDLLNEYKQKFKKDWKEKFTQVVTNTIIICRYNNRTIYINGVDFTLSPLSTFQKTKGNSISYIKYFEEQYNCKIVDKNQPLLFTKKKNSNDIQCYVPELCFLTGLTEDMRNDNYIMKDLKKVTGLTPDQRCKQIVKNVQENLSNTEFNNVLKQWEFKLDSNIISIPGRVLPKEKIQFGKKYIFTDDKRQWNMRSDPIYKGVTISNWICILPERSENDCKTFLKKLFEVSKPLDIKFDSNSLNLVKIKDTSPIGYKKAIESGLQKNTNFILVLLQDDKKERYDTIKRMLTIEVPIPSQCVKWKTISDSKTLASKATKIGVQIASKCGAIPWSVNIALPGPTMICGMDVFHSGETVSRTKPSIVGYTATMDPKMTKYYSRVLINKPGQELTDNLSPFFMGSMKEFKNINGDYPKFIIFYRDGVGEGQLDDLLDKEVAGIEKCFKTLKIKDPPKLTYFVVLKRIHTRLFKELGQNNFVNPSPGTIVDTGITNHEALEFFLVSQNANQGTATPTRYQCIKNTAKFGIDYLETLTFKLCHLYFNWFGTIRVPSVCMYSHKLAFLVGQSTSKEDPELRLSNSLYYL
eukprot:gene8147-12608_t